MGKFFSGTRLFVFLGATILLVVLAGVSLRSRGAHLSLPEKFMVDIFSSASGVLYRPTYDVVTFFQRLQNLSTLYEETAALKLLANENATLRMQLTEQQQQIGNLKRMLHFESHNSQFRLIAAQVTGRSPLTWNAEVTISAGSAEGVRPNMPLLSQDGALVGRVMSVARYNSIAVLMTSTQTADGVSATIVTSGQPPFGIVTGSMTNPGMLAMQFISQLSSNAHVGDLVVTSGLSDIYPKGILIGRISAFTANGSGITRSAVLSPAANMNDLTYVFVLAPRPGQVLP